MTSRPARLDPRRLAAVRDFIEARLGDDLGLDDLARVACLSPHHFCRAFKQSTGVSPHRYLMRRRLERARRLLSDPDRDRSVTDVALDCGFSDASHLSRRFRAAFGTTPSTFRRGERVTAPRSPSRGAENVIAWSAVPFARLRRIQASLS